MSMPGGKQPAERTRDRLSLLRNHPLFQDLPGPVIEHLGSYMKTRKVARGATIFAKGDPGTGLMGVLTGSVKVSVKASGHADVMNNIEDFVCLARVGPRFLKDLDSSGLYGVEGAATAEIRCVWRIPPGASGKSLAGSIELTFRGKPVSQNLSALITR